MYLAADGHLAGRSSIQCSFEAHCELCSDIELCHGFPVTSYQCHIVLKAATLGYETTGVHDLGPVAPSSVNCTVS